MTSGSRASQPASRLISRYVSQIARRPALGTGLMSSHQFQATILPRLQPLPAHMKLFSTSKSLSEKTKLEKWLEEQNAKLDDDIKEMEEFNDAFDFAMRSKGYSESTLRLIHGVSWLLTVSICVATVAGIFWVLRQYEIWPFGATENDEPIVEAKPQAEGNWNNKDQ